MQQVRSILRAQRRAIVDEEGEGDEERGDSHASMDGGRWAVGGGRLSIGGEWLAVHISKCRRRRRWGVCNLQLL